MGDYDDYNDSGILNDKILRLLECPICLEYILPPIYCCVSGSHLLCKHCVVKVKSCPQCNTSLCTKQRCSFAEQVAELIQYPCKFEDNGCEVSGSLRFISRHIKNCPFNKEDKTDDNEADDEYEDDDDDGKNNDKEHEETGKKSPQKRSRDEYYHTDEGEDDLHSDNDHYYRDNDSYGNNDGAYDKTSLNEKHSKRFKYETNRNHSQMRHNRNQQYLSQNYSFPSSSAESINTPSAFENYYWQNDQSARYTTPVSENHNTVYFNTPLRSNVSYNNIYRNRTTSSTRQFSQNGYNERNKNTTGFPNSDYSQNWNFTFRNLDPFSSDIDIRSKNRSPKPESSFSVHQPPKVWLPGLKFKSTANNQANENSRITQNYHNDGTNNKYGSLFKNETYHKHYRKNKRL